MTFCPNPANIRLGEDVLKTSSRRLQEDIISRHLRRHLSKTSWKRFEDVYERHLAKTSWRRLGRQNIITRKTSSRRLQDVLKMSRKTRSVCWKVLTKRYFLPPPHEFSTKSSQYHYWKTSKYSILTLTELGPPVSVSSTGSQNFMHPLTLNTSVIKSKSKISYR